MEEEVADRSMKCRTASIQARVIVSWNLERGIPLWSIKSRRAWRILWLADSTSCSAR